MASQQRPTSSEIINSLKTIGFNVTREENTQTTLSDGTTTVVVPQSVTDESEERLRSTLEPFFSSSRSSTSTNSTASVASRDSMERVRRWVSSDASTR